MKTTLVMFVVSCVVVVGFCSEAHAQNRFLGEGQSGLGLSAALGTAEDVTLIGAGFSYTINSRFDINFGLSRGSYDENAFGENFSSTSLLPGVTLAIVRPTETSILGLEINAGYEHTSYSGDFLDALAVDLSSKAYSVGLDAYLRIDASPALQIMPGLGVWYASASAKLEDSGGNSVEDSVEGALISGNVSFLINQKVFITPSFSTFDGSNSLAISLGYVIPTGQ